MELFVIIAFTHFIALLSPGPDFFLILTTLLRHGRSAAHLVCVGIGLGNVCILMVIYACLFFLGKIDENILLYVRYIGAVYLIYLAALCFYYAKTEVITTHGKTDAVRTLSSTVNYLSQGLRSSVLNPKNILFYSSLVLLVYVDFGVFQHILMVLWMVTVVLVWNILLVKLLSYKVWIDWLRVKSRWLYYISGSCFILFSLMLFMMNEFN
ncbi:LysE family translocator [Acinetobacter bohemicus]|uniref:LysE family translocator n=1 Tax=Acinetobacter bohemicus TaxID=1435036 RepID=UPI004042F366